MRRHLVFPILAVVACSGAEPTLEPTQTIQEPIRQGFKPAGFTNTVFFVADGQYSCTGTNVRYPRCIVTASHCLDSPSYVAGGETPLVNQTKVKKQDFAEYRRRGGSVPWTDVGVEWLEAKEPGAQSRLVPTADYTPMGLGRATSGQFLGRKSTEFGTTSGQPRKAVIIGYGQDGNGTSQVKGIGVANITAYYEGSMQSSPLLGSALRVDPWYATSQIGCVGDSGGPLLPIGGNWDTVGVLSTRIFPSNNDTCASTQYTHYAAFDDDTFNGSAGNYTWTSDTMEMICTQWLTVRIDGSGTVAGGILPKQRKQLGLENNDQIACPGDCIENFHQLDNEHRAPQFMDMVASPDAGWRFLEWRSESKKRKCQCAGSADPSCSVKQQPMGYYDTVESIDEDVCIAVFVQDPNDAGDDGGSDTSMNDGSADVGPGDAPDDALDGGADGASDDASDSGTEGDVPDGGADATTTD